MRKDAALKALEGSGAKVLIVDDDAGFRRTMQAVVSKLGLAPLVASKPAEFLELAAKHKPDLYMIDLQLGDGESGYDLIRPVRAQAGGTVRIFVVSGSGDTASVWHALELGATDFIVKPFDKTQIASKLGRYVGSREISEFQTPWSSLREGTAPATLGVDCELVGIDEVGVKIASAHLIPKGLVVRLAGDFITQLSGAEQILTTVVSTELDPGTQRYQAYAEFDPTNLALMKAVRLWLSAKTSQSGSKKQAA